MNQLLFVCAQIHLGGAQPKRVKVDRLFREGEGVSTVTIKDESIKPFERLARKNGTRYAIKKDKSTSPPTYIIFFKGKNAEVIDNTLSILQGNSFCFEENTVDLTVVGL